MTKERQCLGQNTLLLAFQIGSSGEVTGEREASKEAARVIREVRK